MNVYTYEVYEAFDGTEFDDEASCRAYEQEKLIERLGNNVIALDACGDRISNYIRDIENVRYFNFKTNEAAQELDHLSYELDFELPWGYSDTSCGIVDPQAGIFIWSPQFQQWFSLDHIKETIQEIHDCMEKVEKEG